MKLKSEEKKKMTIKSAFRVSKISARVPIEADGVVLEVFDLRGNEIRIFLPVRSFDSFRRTLDNATEVIEAKNSRRH